MLALIKTICESEHLTQVAVDTVYGQTTVLTCLSLTDQRKLRLLVFDVQSEPQRHLMRQTLETLLRLPNTEGLLPVYRLPDLTSYPHHLAALVAWTDMNLAADIEARRSQGSPYQENMILAIADRVLKAINTLQSEGMDEITVSPANIFVTIEGEIRLLAVNLRAENVMLGRKSSAREEVVGLGLTLWCMVDLRTDRTGIQPETVATLETRVSPFLYTLIRTAVTDDVTAEQLLKSLEIHYSTPCS